MKMKKLSIGVFCLALLFVGSIILPSIGGTYADDVKESTKIRNDTEQGYAFFFEVGHLKDVEIYYNETYRYTAYKGTVVWRAGIDFCPKFCPIPLIYLYKWAHEYTVHKIEGSEPEYHTNIISLPNNQILFSHRYFGMVEIVNPENARHFYSDNFSLDELVQKG